MIWKTTELQALVHRGFNAAWLPPAAYRYLTVRLRDGLVELEPGAYSGVIPLLNGDMLRILPKAGAAGFGRMLFLSQGLTKDTRSEFDDLALVGAEAGEEGDWSDLLARSYPERLQRIERDGLRFESEGVIENRGSVRGRLFPAGTAWRIDTRVPRPVRCMTKHRTTDLPVHRVLAAASRALRRLAPAGRLLRQHENILADWARQWPRIQMGDLDFVRRELQDGSYFGARSYYIGAVTMALLLLEGGGLQLQSDSMVLADPVLVDTASLFERYARTLVQHILAPRGFVVQKGLPRAPAMFVDGTGTMTPDIVVSQGVTSCYFIDAKYKLEPGLSSADAYQIHTYAAALGLRAAGVIRPSDGESCHRRVFTTWDGLVITQLSIGLSDWRAAEEWLTEQLNHLI